VLERGQVLHDRLVARGLLLHLVLFVFAHEVLRFMFKAFQVHVQLHYELEFDQLVELQTRRAQDDFHIRVIRGVIHPPLAVEAVFNFEDQEVFGLLQQIQRLLDFSGVFDEYRAAQNVLDFPNTVARVGDVFELGL